MLTYGTFFRGALNNSQTKFIISLDERQTINKDEKEENSKKLFTFIKEVGKTFRVLLQSFPKNLF